jgi:hypothetical protein
MSEKTKPDWMAPEGRRTFMARYSEYQNNYGEEWGFLYNADRDEVLLAGQDIDWEVRRLPGKAIEGLSNWDAMEQITVAAARFKLVMHLEERMWLAACLRMADEVRRGCLITNSIPEPK